MTCFTFLVLFSKKKKKKTPQKKMVVQQELDCINIEDIGNFEDSPRLVFINEECRNLTEINDGGELAININ